MYHLDTPQRINKSFSITSMVEKQALIQNDMIIEDQYIEISGYASRMYKNGDFVIDADQENVNTFGFDLKRLANGTMPILFNHQQDKPVGKVLEATYDAEGLLIKAKIYKYQGDPLTNFVYNSVKNSVITAFSVGMLVKDFAVVEQDGDEYLQLSQSEVIEVSLVAVPANAEALFRITNIKSITGEDKLVTLLAKSAIKPENPDACNGFECAIKSLQIEPMVQKEEVMTVIKEVEGAIATPEEKEVVLNVTPEALDKLAEIQDPPAAPVEDTKPTEGATVTPEPEDSSIDKGNDKPSDAPKEDLVQTPEEALHNSLVQLTGLDVGNLSDDEMERVYEALAPIMDKINERVVASIAELMKESMTISAPVAE